MADMDGFSVASLTTLCSSICNRAISVANEVKALVSVLKTSNHHVSQLTSVVVEIEALGRNAERLERALNAATATSERLCTDMSKSIANCESAVGTLQKHFMRLQPNTVDRLDQSFLAVHKDSWVMQSQLLGYFADVLSLDDKAEQDLSLDSSVGRRIVEQANSASRLTSTCTDFLLDNKPANSGATLPQSSISERVELSNTLDDPPPYISPTSLSPASPSPVQAHNDAGPSRGFSLTQSLKAFASGLRPKPEPFVSALCQAVRIGDDQQAAGLISQGANVNGRDEGGSTPLKCAIQSDRVGATQLLLDAGAKAATSRRSGLPPLYEAATLGSFNVASLLLTGGASVHDKSLTGQLFFVDVVLKGNLPGVHFLLENGANANAKTITGQAVIAHSASQGSVELVELLLDYGANIDATDIVGSPILATAINAVDTPMIDLLIKRGANINARTCLGTPILADTISRKQVNIVRQLIAHGVDVSAKDIHSQPIIIAVINDPGLNVDEKIDMVRLLAENGADVNAIDPIYSSPAICHAVQVPSAELLRVMLQNNAKTNLRMVPGHTLLSYAIDFNRHSQVKILLEHGADVNEVDGLNRTPLTQAVLRADYNLAQILIDQGADPSAKSNEEALKLAKALGRKDLLGLLGAGEGGSALAGDDCGIRARPSDCTTEGQPQQLAIPPPGCLAAVGR